jgi:putative phosphoesterase
MSDNHSYLGQDVLNHILDSDEVWHAGDMGSMASITPLMEGKIFRGVYGNIDDNDVRTVFPSDLSFTAEGLKVYMTHIGGYPGKYNPRVYQILLREKPDLFICGHSHICKVMQDKKLNLLHMNPGAYGHHGFHVVRTLLKFNIQDGQVKDLHAVELGLRGRIG